VAGLETATRGRIVLAGRDVTALRLGRRNVAMVFQSYALFPHLTVADNIAFGLVVRDTPRAGTAARVRAAAAAVGCEALLERRPAQLSGGERQRVALGRALVRKPQVFLFDEPLSNLDAKLRVQMRREIARLHQQLGTTMIYVTHDQVEAMTLGDRIAVLHRGRLQQVDTPSALYARPTNTFVAGFIGTPPMNLIEGEVVGGGTSEFRAAHGFSVPLRQGWSAALAGRPAAGITLGIRPEDIQRADSATASAGVVRARVELVELLGGEALVHVDAGGVELTARLPAPVPRAGSEVGLLIPVERAHLFDRETGARMELATPR